MKEINKFLNSSPQIFFASVEPRLEYLTETIWGEYLKWKNSSGKLLDLKFRNIGQDIITWKIGDEGFGQIIDPSAPFSKDQYKKGISAVYSFMEDNPQYYKFRKMEGMFNPLRILLYKFIT